MNKLRIILFIVVASFVNVFAANDQIYPVVIIGGGVGGLTSGLYLARAGLQPLIIEGKEASQITQAYTVENWPGEEKISGNDLIEKLKKQAVSNGCVIIPKEVVKVDFSKSPYKITLKNPYKEESENIYASSCIIATGSRSNKLNIEGENAYSGKGVSYCALCDGTFYKNKVVAVIGGGDSALIESTYLSNLAKKVYVIVRKSDFKATSDKKNKDLLLRQPNVEVIFNSEVSAISGDGENVTSIDIKTKDKNLKKLNVDGVFVAIGSTPNTSLFKGQLDLNNEGFIVLKNGKNTSKEGVFAVGDVINNENKQAIIASSSGAEGAIEAQKYLQSKSFSKKEVAGKKETAVNPIIEITSLKQFEKEIKDSKVPVLVDFYASWCGPCKMIAPFLEKSAKELSGVVKFLKVDVDKNEDVARRNGIKAMPTLVVYDSEGLIKLKKVGPAQIEDLISKIERIKNQPLDIEAYIANEK